MYLHHFHHHGTSSPPAITNTHHPDLAVFTAQDVEQRDQYAAAGSAQGVAHRDAPAPDVQPVGTDAQELLIGQRDDRERLVNLPVVHIGDGQASSVQGLGYGEGRGGGEFGRLLRCIGE